MGGVGALRVPGEPLTGRSADPGHFGTTSVCLGRPLSLPACQINVHPWFNDHMNPGKHSLWRATGSITLPGTVWNEIVNVSGSAEKFGIDLGGPFIYEEVIFVLVGWGHQPLGIARRPHHKTVQACPIMQYFMMRLMLWAVGRRPSVKKWEGGVLEAWAHCYWPG